MKQIDLTEYRRSEPVALLVEERDAFEDAVRPANIQPVHGQDAQYYITAGSTVGAIEIGDLSVLIHPKIGIPQLLSLACYAIDQVRFTREDFDYPEEVALPDVMALALSAYARRAFAAGLLKGYRTEEEVLYGVRGRIRFEDQLRRRFGLVVPVEVRYDEFTDDIVPNQLVKAAVMLLGDMRLHSRHASIGLGWVAAMLDNVSGIEFPVTDVPKVAFDRLNAHYQGVVTLSRLILQNGAYQSNRGVVRAQGFLMDMNKVFQEFVTVALREKLGLSPATFGERVIPSLDTSNAIHLRPDLVWNRGSSYVFVGDAKYKNLTERNVPESDLYQLLAYVTALNLSGGLLVYAHGEVKRATYTVRHCEKTLEVDVLDVSGTLDEALARVEGVAEKVRALSAASGRGFAPRRE